MAAGTLSKPGTTAGPCSTPCEHRDCALTRKMAEVVCRHCATPIGYDRNYYDVSREAGHERGTDLVHASCSDDAAWEGA